MARGAFVSSVFAAALGLALAAAPAGASAQVLSIGDDGAVTTYSGPAVYTSDGATAISQPEPTVLRAPPEEVVRLIREASSRHAVPAPIVEAVAWQESRFDHTAISPKGARGVMQLLPATASGLGVDASDLQGNIDGGAAYLAQQLRRFGDVKLALAAYNAGPKAVERYGGVPPYAETQSYVRAIMARLSAASALGAGAP
ncbi:MAG TPA: lytic transglycosylase domain-containing protein [Phenylobacterium sp.]|nr:lytic transglycosylase domain-containing protein [Phenylobacterium sp.]